MTTRDGLLEAARICDRWERQLSQGAGYAIRIVADAIRARAAQEPEEWVSVPREILSLARDVFDEETLQDRKYKPGRELALAKFIMSGEMSTAAQTNGVLDADDATDEEKGMKTMRTFDARTWARSFNETLVKLGYQPHDEGWLIGWFANAIMCGYDECSSRAQSTAAQVESSHKSTDGDIVAPAPSAPCPYGCETQSEHDALNPSSQQVQDTAASQPASFTCIWSQDGEEDSWDTKCGNRFIINQGPSSENRMAYCCYCGGQLIEHPYVEEPVEEDEE